MPKGSMIKASVNVNWPSDQELLAPILAKFDNSLERLAEAVAAEARGTTAFKDRSGKLRRKITVRKNPVGRGYLVESKGGNAHLVEFGHAMVTKDGRTVGRVAAHPYLTPALEKVLGQARGLIK